MESIFKCIRGFGASLGEDGQNGAGDLEAMDASVHSIVIYVESDLRWMKNAFTSSGKSSSVTEAKQWLLQLYWPLL